MDRQTLNNAFLSESLDINAITRTYRRKERNRGHPACWLMLSAGVCLVALAFLSTINRVSLPAESSRSEYVYQGTRLEGGALFEDRINLQQREFASRVHYISEIIRSTRRSSSESRQLAYTIVSESLRAGYDPFFVTAVIRSESTFDRNAVSNVGALGLMQVMPATGRYIAERNNIPWRGAAALKDPQYNIRLGIAYLQYLDERFRENREHVLIAYNWGPTNLNRAFRQEIRIPGSPRHYARTVLNNHGTWSGDFTQRAHQFQYLNVANWSSRG